MLLRTRGTEGAKVILLTVPVSSADSSAGCNAQWNGSSSLHSWMVLSAAGAQGSIDAQAAGKAGAVCDDQVWGRWERPPAPFGDIRHPTSLKEVEAFHRLMVEARQGQCQVATLIEAGVLPAGALHWLMPILESNAGGMVPGADALRHIAAEAGELILFEPERWSARLQSALDDVARRLDRKPGRVTSGKWARAFAETLGYQHDRAGRSTPMARKAQAARRVWEQKQKAINSDGEAGDHKGSKP